MKIYLAAFLLLSLSIFAMASGDETAPMQEKEFKFKDWTYKNLRDGTDVNLRSFAKGKKLVLVVYFAAWCPNWHNESSLVEKLYQKYKDKGFDVVAVSEYASLDETKKHVNNNKFSFTVVSESDDAAAKQKTTHYEMRKAAGDTRNWGSPWNVFLEKGKFKKKGNVLTEKTFVVNGEMIGKEVEAFIRQKLELPVEAPAQQSSIFKKTEVCEPTISLKKP
jgi:peroxiredoxin